ncbi:MAG: sulfite exporter TauE/SafE family protein, partial [Silicimonas sp.]|nr:sulfite exporter TauE/SafE family protein [Silicimonas sp.]
EGLWFLIAAAFVAGMVRGFCGFGTAMVYLPVAGQFLGPFEAIISMMAMDLIAPMIHVPRAMKDGHPGDVLRLSLAAAIAVPVGVLVLSVADPDIFRWTVSLVALTLLTILIAGLRYRGTITKPMIYGTGAAGGFLGGAAGLPGPPVILLYMASTAPAAVVRANNTMYLIVADAIMVAVLWLRGFLTASAVVLGGLLIAPYLAGVWIGGRLFRPELELLYRRIAYAIIATSAITGLPIWD